MEAQTVHQQCSQLAGRGNEISRLYPKGIPWAYRGYPSCDMSVEALHKTVPLSYLIHPLVLSQLSFSLQDLIAQCLQLPASSSPFACFVLLVVFFSAPKEAHMGHADCSTHMNSQDTGFASSSDFRGPTLQACGKV